MRYLSLQEVLELHDRMIQAMGGLKGQILSKSLF